MENNNFVRKILYFSEDHYIKVILFFILSIIIINILGYSIVCFIFKIPIEIIIALSFPLISIVFAIIYVGQLFIFNILHSISKTFFNKILKEIIIVIFLTSQIIIFISSIYFYIPKHN
jgi:hypothetical protein